MPTNTAVRLNPNIWIDMRSAAAIGERFGTQSAAMMTTNCNFYGNTLNPRPHPGPFPSFVSRAPMQ
jgi:hypothetical protein